MSLSSGEAGRLKIDILIADDDPGIRKLLETGLEAQGFRVWSAQDGREALDLFTRHGGEIRLALLDVEMPGLDGPETLKVLRSLRPDLPCCFMTGGGTNYTAQGLLEVGAARVIPKPFSLPEVIEVLHQIATNPDRRVEPRFDVAHAPATLAGKSVRLRDLSGKGLGLWSAEPVGIGSVLEFRLAGEAGRVLSHAVEIRHCRPAAGGWRVGCRLTD